MKKVLITIILTICVAQSIFAQCKDESCGLVIRGKITDLQTEKTKDSVLFYVNLDVEFVNEGNQPIILFTNEFLDGYWLGGWSLYENKEDERVIFGDGYWQSVVGSPAYRQMSEKLDVKTPPSKLTKILQPKESWKFKDDFRIYFEAEKHTRFPEMKTWKEMQAFPSKLWLSFTYELSPWNVERFKPNLIRKLKKRWKNFGNVLVEKEKNSGYDLFRYSSEPIMIDFSQAKEKESDSKN
jgi:hypothetical protein